MSAGPLAWDAATVAEITGGVLFGDGTVAVTAVVTDSRLAGPGALFVAVRGERFDGSDFADEAMHRGAAALLVGEGTVSSQPRIEVTDTLDALLLLAVAHRSELSVRSLAVTGSTGKTSTKDLLSGTLGPDAWASPRSFNNDVGVPLTVLGTPTGAGYLVAEVGSRGAGHITRLVPAVLPEVAIITNIGVVHLETFGSTDAIVAAKWELVEGLVPGGTAVLPAGEPRLVGRAVPSAVTFGDEAGAMVRIESLRLDDIGRPSFLLRTPWGTIPIRLAVAGGHQAWNAAAAAAAALTAGASVDDVAAGMASVTGSAWRMEVHRGRFTVVNDAYNANPDSTEAALRAVHAMPGRSMAVLGLMAELGPVTVSEHIRIGRLAAELGFDPVVVVGPDPGFLEGAGAVGVAAGDEETAAEIILGTVGPGGVVLVKASRVAGLERLALALAAESGALVPDAGEAVVP